MGLANMRDRAQALGGSLAVLSTPGQGTVVRATVVTERSG
jgi:signal transduction histidine kinase